MKRRGAVLLLAVAAAVGLSTASAGAEGSRGWHARVLVVDKDSHHHKSCYGKHRRIFRTIQSAVDAADSGDTIKVCPGTYSEVVTVREPDLAIKGANAGRDATRHGRGRESIIAGVAGTMVPGLVQLRADDITWDGFTILGAPGAQNNPPGMYTSPTHSGYLIRDTIFQDNGSGIHLGANGAHPTLVCRNRFTANNEFEGPTGAYGIYSNQGARQALITSNRFERHNSAAIFLADQGTEPRQRDVLIEHNKSVDDMSFATIFNSIRVRVTSNWVRARVNDPPFTDEPASAIFIGARNNDIVVEKNKIKSASGNGIDISNTGGDLTAGPPPRNVVVRKNKVAHAQLSGIEVSATGVGQYQVLGNRSLDNDVFGIHFVAATSGGTVTGNTALGNKEVDCRDRSTGPKNTWTSNAGASSLPPALCAAPTVDDDPGHDGKGHDKKKSKKHKKHHKTKKHKKHRPDPCVCTLPWRF
jgi:nitrous oxidase accessory protein NosD